MKITARMRVIPADVVQYLNAALTDTNDRAQSYVEDQMNDWGRGGEDKKAEYREYLERQRDVRSVTIYLDREGNPQGYHVGCADTQITLRALNGEEPEWEYHGQARHFGWRRVLSHLPRITRLAVFDLRRYPGRVADWYLSHTDSVHHPRGL